LVPELRYGLAVSLLLFALNMRQLRYMVGSNETGILLNEPLSCGTLAGLV